MAYAKREKFKCFEFFKTKYDNVKRIKKYQRNQCEVDSSFYDIDKQLDLFLKCKRVKSSTIKFHKTKRIFDVLCADPIIIVLNIGLAKIFDRRMCSMNRNENKIEVDIYF